MSGSAPVALGVALDLARPGPNVGAVLDDYVPLIRAAEQGGLTSLWAGQGGGAGPDDAHLRAPMLGLAALAPRTRLRLGLGVLLLPTWNPLALAYEGAILDQISGGRFTMGVGTGRAPTWATFGIEPHAVRALVDDMMRALKALWSGADGYHGEVVSIDGRLGMLPVQRGGPPLWVGGHTTYATRRAATLGDGWYSATGDPFDHVKQQADRYRRELGRAGKDPSRARIAVNRVALVAETDGDALHDAESFLSEMVRRYGVSTRSTDSNHLAAASRAFGGESALVGSPETIVASIARYAEAGITDIQLRVASSGVPLAVAMRTIQLVGEHVLPRLGAL